MIVFDTVTYKQTMRDQWQVAAPAWHQSSPLRALARREVHLRGLGYVPTCGGGFRGEPRRAPSAGFNRRPN